MADSKSKKILVVEDEKAYSRALVLKLQNAGYEAQSVSNGEEALEIIKKEHFDLMLSDLIMPKMDGVVMLRKLRSQDEWGKKVPVILLTNLNSSGTLLVEEVQNNQPADYLVKSDTSLEDLITKIKEMIK